MPEALATLAAAHGAILVAFDPPLMRVSGIVRLEGQARALSGLAAAHSSSAQLHSYASRFGGDDADSQHMSGMMRRWHHSLPSRFQMGAGMGPGMMSGHDWAEMRHLHGHEFNDHWLVAMMANRSAELALCRDEFRAGVSSQARHLAQAMLTGRLAQLGQLQRWHHTMDHGGRNAG